MKRNRKTRERYKRLIKLSFAAVMLLGLCMLYAVAWSGYYNKAILQMPFYRRGNWKPDLFTDYGGIVYESCDLSSGGSH